MYYICDNIPGNDDVLYVYIYISSCHEVLCVTKSAMCPLLQHR